MGYSFILEIFNNSILNDFSNDNINNVTDLFNSHLNDSQNLNKENTKFSFVNCCETNIF